MKKFLMFLCVVLLLVTSGCTGQEELSIEELPARILEENSAKKLKAKYGNIYYMDERTDNAVSYYSDQVKNIKNIYAKNGVLKNCEVYDSGFLYASDQDGNLSQIVVLNDVDDYWTISEELLNHVQIDDVETTDSFYILTAHVNEENFPVVYEGKKDIASAMMNLMVSRDDFTLQSIQNETITYKDGSKETMPEMDILFNQGEADTTLSDLIESFFKEVKDYRTCTIISELSSGQKNTLLLNIAKGVQSGVLLPEGHSLLASECVLDDQTLENDLIFYITDKEEGEPVIIHNEPMSEDGVYPDDASGFVLISSEIPDAILEIRYATTYNFVGDVIDGYEEPIAILSKEAAQALKGAAADLKEQGYRLKIWDAYRPQMAVDHFVKWGGNVNDARMKEIFYPEIDRAKLFELGFIAEQSSHTRGSAVDLTLFDMRTGKEVDMGSPFDYFGEISHPDYEDLTPEQLSNRAILKDAMVANGFEPIDTEWWHFTLANEPYPNTYFTFPVSSDSIGE